MASAINWIGRLFAPTRFPIPPIQDELHPMKAIVVKKHGPPEVLEYVDFPTPHPQHGSKQVVVDIVAAGINPVDFKLRKGPIADFLYPKPKVVGADMAGIVSFAPEGSCFKKGQRVYAMLPFLSVQYGSYAEKCCVDEDILALAPSNYPLVDVASIPLVATTVVQALRPVKDAYKENIKGKRIFITSGSGGLGTFAIQYCAKELGMYVATACSPKNFEFLKSLGANETIDYKTVKFEDYIANYDVVLDPMGYQNEEIVLYSGKPILKPSTADNPSFYLRIASSPYGEHNSHLHLSPDPLGMAIPEARLDRMFTSFSKQFVSNVFHWLPNGIRYYFVLVSSEKQALEEVCQAMEKGNIRPIIQEKIPLQEAVRAHHLLEEGHVIGKIVLVVNDSIDVNPSNSLSSQQK